MGDFRRLLIANAQIITPTVREFRFTIKTTSNNYTYSFSINNGITNYNIDWGDSSAVGVGETSHKYVTAGTYQIRVYDTATTTTFPLLYFAINTENSILQSVDTPFPYIDNVTDFQRIFRNNAGLISVANGLFDNNPQITSLQETFCYCRKLETLPAYIFRNLVNCYNFNQTIRGTRGLFVTPTLFCDESTEMATRFASYTTKVDFSNFLYRISPSSSSLGGTAPELWNYTYGAGVTSTDCFNGNSTTNLTNYNSIPSSWR